MNEIVLKSINKADCSISYDFAVSQELSKYFSGKNLVFEYPVDVSEVPDAVAAVPFVCNVLPIVWLTNSKLRIPELDAAFFNCIAKVRDGYEKIYPESTFSGEVLPDRIVECKISPEGASAVFFSGGLDATQTLITHFDEKPHLISIWGSDIRYANQEGWDVVHKGIAETAERFSLPDVVIRSTFRDFDREEVLDSEFSDQLKDGWWHGIKHSLGLLGHAAPYAYLMKLGTVYIASSNCPADGIVRCASSPLTDNHVRFAGCRVIHDGYEYSRQDKARNLVDFCTETGKTLKLHACWQSQKGSNCGCCEKCYRTMTAIIAEGGDPVEYGFENAKISMKNMRNYLLGGNYISKHLAEHHWLHIQKRILANTYQIKRGRYWKDVKWLCKMDFAHFDNVKKPIIVRLRVGLAKYKFYQRLHRMKKSISFK